jgi:hypothetical protein
MNAQALTPVVRFVEVALAKVHDQTAQETLADQLGYLCHSPISRALGKVRDGKADGLCSVYTARELILLALKHNLLADALRTALAGSSFGNGQGAERSLSALGQSFAGEIAAIFADLGDGELDDREADRHLIALDRIVAEATQAKANLIQRKSTRSRT